MNTELFREVLEYIKANPKQWKQSEWVSVDEATSEFCGCFAGHLLLKGRGGAIGNGAVDMIADTAKALSISLQEAYFLTRTCRTIADFEFFLANGSIANPANGRLEDANGYSAAGYDATGYNRHGYNRDGYDRYGYGRDGYDISGFDSDGYDREGYDPSGYDTEGYNQYGYNRDGYDSAGIDRDGYNRYGHKRKDTERVTSKQQATTDNQG